MDTEFPITDKLSCCSAQLRLIANLMLSGPRLDDDESASFALMLRDLATRIEGLMGESESSSMERGERP